MASSIFAEKDFPRILTI